jgi:hypothetical protein
MAKSEVVLMVKTLREVAGQGTLSEESRLAALDAASFIEAVTAALFDARVQDPGAAIDSLKAIYAKHRFG